MVSTCKTKIKWVKGASVHVGCYQSFFNFLRTSGKVIGTVEILSSEGFEKKKMKYEKSMGLSI